MRYIIKEEGYQPEKTEFFGNKFLIGNGYMGYRGTLEEYTKKQLKACTLAGVYDKYGDKWREPVTIPDLLYVSSCYNKTPLSVLENTPISHEQMIELDKGVHRRNTVFQLGHGKATVKSCRLVSMANQHLMAQKYTISADIKGLVEVTVKLDQDIWNLNGPHLNNEKMVLKDRNILLYSATTMETKTKIACAQKVSCSGAEIIPLEGGFLIKKQLNAGEKMTVFIYGSVYKASDCNDCMKAAENEVTSCSFQIVKREHCDAFKKIWDRGLVRIEGDQKAEIALMYNCYLLLCSAPFHTSDVAIAGRGLSGQVYKGAMFWDTEIYMLPYFVTSFPETARNLVEYRIKTLDGARKKAREYGYRGAFYAWESQETGEDYCTDYNINDIFTGRPIRTYFREKQIHISADVAYGLIRYYEVTNDESILINGGYEVILECSRFLYSYSYYKTDKNRYELLDVTGADEYHERENNDAYTNFITYYVIQKLKVLNKRMKEIHQEFYSTIIRKLSIAEEMKSILEFGDKLYVPNDLNNYGVIPQNDDYFKKEDLTPSELRKRILKENEYLGSPSGIAVNTQVIKQGDVILLTSLFPDHFTKQQKLNNFKYYEPRTEHGSSLSTCMYALTAANCGLSDYAYEYFKKTAEIDYLGNYKRYVGDLYIGGTHPAANGGCWMVAVMGFAGLYLTESEIRCNPALPKKWKAVELNCWHKGQKFFVRVEQHSIIIVSDKENKESDYIACNEKRYVIRPGETVQFDYREDEE